MTLFFKGRFALFAKIVILSIVSAVLLMLCQSAFAQREYAIAGFLLLAVLAMNYVYLTNKRTVPFKFFLPGTLFLVAFVIAPIIFTVVMSSYNYKTGNIISKEEAIERVSALGVEPDENGTTFDIVIGKAASGEWEILVSDITNNRYFLSTKSTIADVPISDLKRNEFQVATEAPGFKRLSAEVLSQDEGYSKIQYKYLGEYFIVADQPEVGAVFRQTLKYHPENDTFINLQNGQVYRDNGRGNYANPSDKAQYLEPGWRAPNWFSNYAKLVTDDKVRGPFIRVFIWTVIFAVLTVLTSFAFGLLLALALNKAIRGRRMYRSILILPYAMPSLMSILIWAGMFDTEFGAINNILGTHIAWFSDANFARAAVILVSLWLGFPYFYLISTGALQAIPSELNEAAAIDGANGRQIFNKITLPLLFQILAPLLIASFAFNFNNFNLIYLLTGGGPKEQLEGQIAGATDILISYTYQIAFGSNTQDLGLASAISVIIFFLVASISLYGLRKSKVLETFG
ncbi:MAG: ABC transporter permease subunit [Actinobacteria bacterium]|nr:ABC transporter permease subunit [Actinomycetota bacterium]